MSWYKIPLALTAALLYGCSGGGRDHVHHEPAPYYGPELYEFNIIDSYGIDSEFDHSTDLEIEPYAPFDLKWDVYAEDDFRVSIGINQNATMTGAIVIDERICGWGLDCDEETVLMCEYTDDGYMGCGFSFEEVEYNYTPMYDMLDSQIPTPLYINIEVCDIDYRSCEYSSVPVYFF